MLKSLSILTVIAAFSGTATPASAQIWDAGDNSIGIKSVPHSQDFRTPCHCQHYFRRSQQALERGDGAQALAWLQRGARRGDRLAMRGVGQILLAGEGGVPRNAQEALRWFYEAALAGDATSMFVLGRAFETGIGVDRDPALARAWLRRAASEGYRPR